jgi:hypothetical protein
MSSEFTSAQESTVASHHATEEAHNLCEIVTGSKARKEVSYGVAAVFEAGEEWQDRDDINEKVQNVMEPVRCRREELRSWACFSLSCLLACVFAPMKITLSLACPSHSKVIISHALASLSLFCLSMFARGIFDGSFSLPSSLPYPPRSKETLSLSSRISKSQIPDAKRNHLLSLDRD